MTSDDLVLMSGISADQVLLAGKLDRQADETAYEAICMKLRAGQIYVSEKEKWLAKNPDKERGFIKALQQIDPSVSRQKINKLMAAVPVWGPVYLEQNSDRARSLNQSFEALVEIATLSDESTQSELIDQVSNGERVTKKDVREAKRKAKEEARAEAEAEYLPKINALAEENKSMKDTLGTEADMKKRIDSVMKKRDRDFAEQEALVQAGIDRLKRESKEALERRNKNVELAKEATEKLYEIQDDNRQIETTRKQLKQASHELSATFVDLEDMLADDQPEPLVKEWKAFSERLMGMAQAVASRVEALEQEKCLN